MVLDYGEATVADVYSDAEVVTLFSKTSNVPGKHKTGGQSAARMERCRDNEIKLWFKELNSYLLSLDRDEVVLGISDHYYNRFKKTLHTYSLEKISKQVSTGYSNLSGIYEVINILSN